MSGEQSPQFSLRNFDSFFYIFCTFFTNHPQSR